MKRNKITKIDVFIIIMLFIFSTLIICLPGGTRQVTDENGLFCSSTPDAYLYARRAFEFAENGKIDLLISRPDDPLMNSKDDGDPCELGCFMSAIAAIIIRITGINAHIVVAYFEPIILALSVIPAYLFVTKRTTRFGGVVAALTVALAPSIVSRSYVGMFDTDGMLAFLPLCLLTCVLESLEAEEKKVRFIYAFMAGIFLIMLRYTWASWYTYGFPALIIAIFAVAFGRPVSKGLPALGVMTVTFVPFAIKNNLFKDFLGLLSLTDGSVQEWPNAGGTVSELTRLSFDGLINLAGGAWFMICVIIGLVLIIWERKKVGTLTTVFLLIWFVATAYFATKGIRFVTMLALPSALIAGLFVGLLPRKLCEMTDSETGKTLPKPFLVFSLVLCMSVAVVPVLYSFDTVKAISNYQLASDDMSDACCYLRDNSPEDCILVTWWDYGYYYQYAAERMPLYDGGSFSGHRNVMMARGLMSNDSAKAVSCFNELLGESINRDKYLIISEDMLKKVEAISDYADWQNEKAKQQNRSYADALMFRLFTEEKDSQGVFKPVYCNDSVKIFSY